MKEKYSFYDFIFQPKHIVIGLKKIHNTFDYILPNDRL